MIVILYIPNSLSCNKALKFFNANNIIVKKINLISSSLSEKKIYDILHLTNGGFKDIINKDHKYLKLNKINVDDLKLKQLVHLLQHEPIILKKPIIIQYKDNHPYRLLVGYNKNDIKIFLRKD